jgi:hypothetical protein
MENQEGNHSPKLNPKSEISLWTGIGSLAPYLYGGSLYLLMNKIHQVEFLMPIALAFGVFMPLYFLGGIFFGLISLITGAIVLWQVKNNLGNETGNRFAIAGIVLGVLGIITNIMFWYAFFAWLKGID